MRPDFSGFGACQADHDAPILQGRRQRPDSGERYCRPSAEPVSDPFAADFLDSPHVGAASPVGGVQDGNELVIRAAYQSVRLVY
jgi:hypothetical protein